MNYRHAFHSGNFADVHKHVTLCLLLSHLKKKETPFAVIDTHAGAGFYDLASIEAAKTGEAEKGVRRLIGAEASIPVLADYLAVLAACNPGWPTLRYYPGSPEIIRQMLRPQDRAMAIEMHPGEMRVLRHNFARDKRMQLHEGDGWKMLSGLVPPVERRGLILIDPPFEQEDEFRRIAGAVTKVLARWPNGIVAIWHPIKDGAQMDRFQTEMAGLRRPCLLSEFVPMPPDDPTRLSGSGMLILNPPWQLDQGLEEAMAVFRTTLGDSGRSCVRWLVDPI